MAAAWPARPMAAVGVTSPPLTVAENWFTRVLLLSEVSGSPPFGETSAVVTEMDPVTLPS